MRLGERRATDTGPDLKIRPTCVAALLRSEHQPEAELPPARLIRDVDVLARLTVSRIDFGQRVTAVVFVIEEIEDLRHGVTGNLVTYLRKMRPA